MTSDKKRILFVGEASFMATGFSNYYDQLLRRLHKTGKYELAEIGAYSRRDDPRIQNIPWKFYATLPTNEKEKKIYDATKSPRTGQNSAQFGEHVFDKVLLDFMPDIVCFPPGTQVETPDGPKNIEDIQTGDKIINHKGEEGACVAVMEREYDGDLVTIELEDGKILSGTPNHPILVRRNGKQIFIPMGALLTTDDVVTLDEIYEALSKS